MHLENYLTRSGQYLIYVSFADWVCVALMLIAALLSFGTASFLPKTSFDFIFHFVMGILVLVGGVLVSTYAFDNHVFYNTKKAQAASVSFDYP